MKATLALRASQSLALTPQLQLAIRVLRMSAQELAEEVREATLSNPLLEIGEGEPAGSDEGSADEPWAAGVEATPEAGKTTDTGPDAESDARAENALDIATDESDHDERWDNLPSRGTFDDDGSRETAADIGLKQHVWSQVECLGLHEHDLAIAAVLVDALEDDGYFREDIQIVRDALGLADLPDARVEAVRHQLLALDPTGVGARNLTECLMAQLAELPDRTPGIALARRLVSDHLDRLGDRAEKVAAALGLTPDDYACARNLVASLDPRPGSRFIEAATDHVVPDVEAYRERGRWRVRLVDGTVPRLRLNATYAGLANARGGAGQTWVHARLQEARWLIRSVEQREDTLLRVTTAIVDHQGAYFDFGPQAMRPLSMREIADRLSLHESTVSRAVSHKYLATPRGTIELRRFFATGLATSSGGSASSTAIQTFIHELIANEPADGALSDQTIVERLQAQGILVARRTVAKYREALGIPSSHERQRSARH